ncbi:hypothetical protein [Ktedonospora formicarum]|uniref:Uncharacterized protein n=1 Tax=Ktedonospora formicarum TaxID=2778364 RepID=A0A8J3MWK0_9CHLR|nr:hypothetical protein [Ktedonospora formicarum]GHO49076.1 hypothetical protein KSX_72390 [Ktedonospora formicarum]
MASSSHSPAAQANRGEISLYGRRLRVLQILWILLVQADLSTLVMSFPGFYQGLHTVCADPHMLCISDQLNTLRVATLQHAGFSIHTYALYVLIWDALTTVIFLLFGGLIFWRKSNTWMGIFISFFLINLGSLGTSFAHSDWIPEHGSLLIEIVSWEATLLSLLVYPCLAFFFFTFPDGRLVPRWSWALIGLWIINAFAWIAPIEPLNIVNWHPLFQSLWLFVVYGGSLSTQVYRFWRVASPTQRQQIKWLFYGYAPVFLITVFGNFLLVWFPSLDGPDSLLAVALTPLYRWYYLPVPICIGIALLRYRLWDIDVLINRTLVYGSLTAILLGIYLLLVFVGQHLLVSVLGHNDAITLVISTLIIASLFQPLRHRVQQLVDKRFYRKKYDAAKMLSSFTSTLHEEINLEQLSAHLLDVIEETMQPTYISLWLCSPVRSVPSESEVSEELEPTLQKSGKLLKI